MKHFLIYHIFLLLTFLLSSCIDIKKEYYENGVLYREYSMDKGVLEGVYKEYYENGDMKLIHHYRNGRKIDSSVLFYPNSNNIIKVRKNWEKEGDYYLREYYSNGIIKFEGFVKDSIRIGTWKYYKNSGVLDESREYMNVEGGSYLNQVYNVNFNGDTLYQGSNFIRIVVAKDTIELNEPFRAIVYLEGEFFRSKEVPYIKVSIANNIQNFKSDFSNAEEVNLDKFNNLLLDTANQKWYPNVNKRRTAVFGKYFKDAGDKHVRGYVSEFIDKQPTTIDSSIAEERRIYFDKRIYVKDSV